MNLRVEVQLNKSPDRCWYYYFDRINEWWSSDYYTSKRTTRFVVDTFIGGRMYEDFGNGQGLVWAEIIGVDRPKTLQLKGYLSSEFGGPLISFDKFSFENIDSGTKLTYTSDFMGRPSDRTVESLRTGWVEILEKKFKPYCESF